MRWIPMLLAAALALSAAAVAQGPTPSPEPAEKMRALEFLAGEWEGEAWIQMGPDGRETVTQREHVGWGAGREVLLIQGQGLKGDQVVHDALAAIAWDPQAGEYVIWTYRAGGGPSQDPTIEVGDDRVVWGFEAPGRKVRFTIRLDEGGRWIEDGEWSGDGGATWRPFFGMTLTKK